MIREKMISCSSGTRISRKTEFFHTANSRGYMKSFIYLSLIFFVLKKDFKGFKEEIKEYHSEVVCMPEMLVVKAKVREACGDMSVASDFITALNEKVDEIIKKALWRAKENGRRTVMGKDV